jgi:hypothetical protein
MLRSLITTLGFPECAICWHSAQATLFPELVSLHVPAALINGTTDTSRKQLPYCIGQIHVLDTSSVSF